MINAGAFVVLTAGAASKRRKGLGAEIRPGSESRAKAAKGSLGTLEIRLTSSQQRSRSKGARPDYQSPGAAGGNSEDPQRAKMKSEEGK
jgi:hypothetical protein